MFNGDYGAMQFQVNLFFIIGGFILSFALGFWFRQWLLKIAINAIKTKIFDNLMYFYVEKEGDVLMAFNQKTNAFITSAEDLPTLIENVHASANGKSPIFVSKNGNI